MSGWTQGDANWWLSGGVSASNAIGVYQPINATSLAASYSNLANPGTYDAAPGVAPTFATATGWTFNGSTQYLTTGVVPVRNTWSMIVKFTSTTPAGYLAGLADSGINLSFGIVPRYSDTNAYYDNGGEIGKANGPTSGVLAVAGNKAYRNGTDEGVTIGAGSGVFVSDVWIGRFHYSTPYWYAGNIQALAIYNTALSSSQVSAITTAMNAISASVTRDTSIKYAGTASAKVKTLANYNVTQSVNAGDTNTYNLSGYAYTDGSAVTSADAQLVVNGSTISTTYTSVGGGWYQLTGTTAGTASSIAYGVQVKANKTVYVDNMSLNNYASSGTLTSNIFDTEQLSAWGTLTYSFSGSTVAVKARSSNSSSMVGATDFSSCTAITSGADISSNNCITDGHRYIQYQVALSTSDTSSTPTFSDISIAFSSFDTAAPSVSFTALSPDPNSDTTPTLSGTATEETGTVSAVQFQMDSTSGSWTACTASDGTFNSASEAFSCTASTLTDGSHTMYVRATDSNGNTTSSGYASDVFTIDATVPSTPGTPSTTTPTNSTSQTWSWTAATDALSGVASYAYRVVDSVSNAITSGTTSALSVVTNLTQGVYTFFVKAIDTAGNSGSETSSSVTVDTASPVSIDLDSPGNNTYTNSERPTFRWKATTDATAGLSKYVLEINNPSIGDDQPSGDFTIDSIPTSRTTDFETNKYTIHYENFNDSDTTNNYISVYTKSSSDWSSSENDGKVREGRVSWKVKVVDNAGNETSSSRILFVDRTNPNVTFTQINSTPYTSNNFNTTDKTPTIFGKITDPLAGADNDGQTKQDENGPKVASGPKEVTIKVEKKEGLTYKLVTLYKITMDTAWWTCDNKEITDNSKQKCDKYLPFEYTPKENLELGIYKITLNGKDKADNASNEVMLTLHITTLAQITTPEEKEIIKEETKDLKPEEKKEIQEILEITKPIETVTPNALEKAGETITHAGNTVIQGTGTVITTLFTRIGKAIAFMFNAIGHGIAFVFNKTGQLLAFVGNGIGTILNNTGQAIGNGYNAMAHHTHGVTKNILLAIGTTTHTIVDSTGRTIQHVTTTIHNGITSIAFAVGEKTQNVSDKFGLAIITFTYNFVSEPTTISDVKIAKLSATSVTITWKTNHPATGKVNYGVTKDFGQDTQSTKRSTNHIFTVTDLQPNTHYFYEVMSQNKNYVYDANHQFRTPAK